MRPIQVTLPGAGVTVPIVLDTYIAPGNITFSMIMQGGGPTAVGGVIVEHTNDMVMDPAYNPATGNWVQYAYTGSTVTYSFTDAVRILEGVYAFTPKAIRFRATNTTSNPTWLFQVTQVGITT